MTIQYSSADPAFAAAVANAFAQAYIETAVELKVEPAKQYASWFGDQGKALRENLEKAQARLSEFHQQKGIVAKEDTLDTENTRLVDLNTQLTISQAQTADSRSKQRSGATELPEVMNNSLVAGLRNDIARQEAKLKEVSGNLGKNHPSIMRMQAEIAELRLKLEAETRLVTRGFSASTSIGRDKEEELKSAIQAQKKRLLQLRGERDQLAVLQRDVDAAKNAYDAVVRRYTDANLQSQATQTNVSLLNTATEPLEPSSPKLARNIPIGLVLGVMIGLAAAFFAEFLDRRIRGADDLANLCWAS
jgi:chain length determinant protein EpsF